MAKGVVSNLETTGGCQWRTSILPVTAAEIRAVRRSCISAIADSARAIRLSNLAQPTGCVSCSPARVGWGLPRGPAGTRGEPDGARLWRLGSSDEFPPSFLSAARPRLRSARHRTARLACLSRHHVLNFTFAPSVRSHSCPCGSTDATLVSAKDYAFGASINCRGVRIRTPPWVLSVRRSLSPVMMTSACAANAVARSDRANGVWL